MKRRLRLTLLMGMLALAPLVGSFAQCTPDTTRNFTGNWPARLDTGCVGSFYSDTMYFSYPKDTTVIVPVSLDSYWVSSISRPAWASYDCNTPDCKWKPGNTLESSTHFFGCIVISGTPDVPFDGDIGAMIAAYGNPLIGPDQVDSALSDFPLYVGNPVAGFTDTIAGATVNFGDTSSGAATYLWDFGDGLGTSTLPVPSYTYPSPGNYLVCQTVMDGPCEDSTCHYVNVTVVNAEGMEDFSGLSLFPNPSSGTVHLAANIRNEGMMDIRIVDLSGRILIESYRMARQGNIKWEFDLSGLSAGMYWMDVRMNDDRKVSKIILR